MIGLKGIVEMKEDLRQEITFEVNVEGLEKIEELHNKLKSDLLIVKVHSIVSRERLKEKRKDILEQLEEGVLVIDDSCSYEVVKNVLL